ncbi:MAG: phospholipase D-like domain-containing protein [Planctomycetota bacterium]
MFQRCLFLFQAGHDPSAALAAARALVPAPEHLLVVAHLRGAASFWRPEPQHTPNWSLAELQRPFEGWAAALRFEVVWALDAEAVRALADEVDAEAVLIGPVAEALERELIEGVARDALRPALWLGGRPTTGPPREEGAGRVWVCPFDRDPRALAPAGAFLREHAQAGDRIVLLALRAPDPPLGDLATVAEVSGLSAPPVLHVLDVDLTGVGPWLFAALTELRPDLVVAGIGALGPVAQLSLRLLAGELLDEVPAPVLLLPPREPGPGAFAGRLDAPDALVEPGQPLRLSLDRVDLLGQPHALDEGEVSVIAGGRRLTRLAAGEGLLELDPDLLGEHRALGLGRALGAEVEPLDEVEAHASLVPTAGRALVLLDAGLPPDDLTLAAERLGPDGPRGQGQELGERLLLAVRAQGSVALATLREGLRAAGLGALPLLDLSALLDDGRPGDLPDGVEGLRLARAGAHLRARGVTVLAVVARGGLPQRTSGFAFLRAEDLRALDDEALAAALAATTPPPADDAARLTELTGAAPSAGNAVRFELENAATRAALLARIEAAARSVHFQVYIASDDEFGRALAAALEAAGARGVAVRALVDSLYSGHGSLGQRNALLARLEAAPGVCVRVHRPVEGLPSLEALKQRDHRKLWVFDGACALLTGRNLSRSYFTGFDEVALAEDTPWDAVPWYDAGVELRGPLVAEVERSFAAAWAAAGGEVLAPSQPPPAAGEVRARLVVHEGLRDGRALDAYLALFAGARRRIWVANTFPILQELQHALLRALARGVEVTLLFGSVRPAHGEPPRPFPGGVVRELADRVIRGRIDVLVGAGAAAYELVLPDRPGWSVRGVRPHLHAKLVSVDGERCSVGSANLDVTAGYWESEATLLIEDPGLAGELERELAALVATSRRLDPQDPGWQELAAGRAWLSRHWPSVLG